MKIKSAGSPNQLKYVSTPVVIHCINHNHSLCEAEKVVTKKNHVVYLFYAIMIDGIRFPFLCKKFRHSFE